MTTASAEAYQKIIGKVKGKQFLIYTAIMSLGDRGLTIGEIHARLSWPYGTVSARVTELTNAGVIKAIGTRDGQTVWIRSLPEDVEALRAARAAARKAKKEAQVKRLQDLEAAVKRVRTHKAELFEDGVSADLAQDGITTIPAAFMAGYDECHRVMVELLATEA